MNEKKKNETETDNGYTEKRKSKRNEQETGTET